MARGGERDGFNVDNIVKINSNNKSSNTNKEENNNNVPSVIDKLKTETHEKTRIFVYLDKDLAYKVKAYGAQIGKNRGGNSKIVSEALKLYFKKNNL